MDLLRTLPNLLTEFNAYQHSFHSGPIIQWHRDHAEIPIIAIAVYLVMVFGGKDFMKNRQPFKLKPLFAAWNLLLSVFSIGGAFYMVPLLAQRVYTHGLMNSVCSHPEWYYNGASGFWLMLFIYSKFAELLDTMFLVARKKKVIFLHWFHHVTVLLYCWHAYHHAIGAGIWFACMNYCVHSIMYMYYFMTNVGLYKLVAPFAQLITTVQILQMVGGMGVLITVAITRETKGEQSCIADSANWKLGLSMYFSYFILFSILFVQKYLVKPKDASSKYPTRADKSVSPINKKHSSSGVRCPPEIDMAVFGSSTHVNALDASGFFHSSQSVNNIVSGEKKVN